MSYTNFRRLIVRGLVCGILSVTLLGCPGSGDNDPDDVQIEPAENQGIGTPKADNLESQQDR